MPFQRSNNEAQIVQETATDVLAGALSQHGAKQHIAQAAGLKLPALSRILTGNHMPTVKTAQRIAPLLPIPAGEQTDWLSLVAAYWKLRRENAVLPFTGKDQYDKAAFVALRWRHHVAQFNDHPQGKQVSHESVYDDALNMIAGVSPRAHPRAFVALCSMLQDTADAMGHNTEALLWAKRCRHAAQFLNPHEYPSEEQEFALDLGVNSIRSEAAMLHKVGLDRASYELCAQARHTDGFARDRGYWEMQVTRDQIHALAGIPRFTLSEAEGLATQARRAAERSTHEAIPMLDMLLSRALAMAYLAHGRPRLALRELSPVQGQIDRIPMAGPAYVAMFWEVWTEAQAALHSAPA